MERLLTFQLHAVFRVNQYQKQQKQTWLQIMKMMIDLRACRKKSLRSKRWCAASSSNELRQWAKKFIVDSTLVTWVAY